MVIDRIDPNKCIGCGECLSTCPAQVFHWNELREQPEIRHPEECLSCALCRLFCPADAIVQTGAAFYGATLFPA